MPFVSARDERVRSSDLNFQEDFKPKSTAGDVYGATIMQTIDEDLTISSKLNRESYRERKSIVKDLIESGEINGRDYVVKGNGRAWGGGGASTFNYDALSEKYPQVRKDNDLREERNATLKSRRDYANDVFERGPAWPRFIATPHALLLDPVSVVTMPIGYSVGTARGLLAVGNAMLKVGATEMLVETGIQGFVYGHKQDIDSPYSYQEALTNIGAAAFGSALLAGTGMGIKEYISSIRTKTKGLPQSEQLDFADETLARMEDTLSDNPLRKEGMTSKELVEADKEFLTELEVRRTKVDPVQVERKEYAKIDGTPQASSRELSVMDRIGQAEEYKQDMLAYEQRFKDPVDMTDPREQPAISEGFKITNEAVATKKSRAESYNHLIKPDYDTDSLLIAVAKKGGLDKKAWQGDDISLGDYGNSPSVNKIFSKATFRDGGMTPDDLSEFLFENGYTPKMVDANEAIRLVKQELDGDLVFTPNGAAKNLENDLDQRMYDSDLEDELRIQTERDAYTDGMSDEQIRMFDEALNMDVEPKTYNQNQLDNFTKEQEALYEAYAKRVDEEGRTSKSNESEAKTKETETRAGVSIEIDGVRYDSNEYIKGIDSEIEGIEAVNRCLLG